ncbi:unnamed protein product [Caenorhabditis bovis]|uniref:Uncharacterized protein n=1 Tax=Caenorhabditis bovis TaxID=2654633 RepID=A0A8S1EVX2_9PELO|nr:unnamed protein product [Caenorhabditis bovis]
MEEEAPKKPRPFLRKGQELPSSARRDLDSGISNEGVSPFGDDSRPPTMSSYRADSAQNSVSPGFTRTQPSVLEEQDLEIEKPPEEDVEEVSALQPSNRPPSFIPDSAYSTTPMSTSCSIVSDEQRKYRQEAKDISQRAKLIASLDSMSPGSSSGISTPLGASTPITDLMQNNPSKSTNSIELNMVTPQAIRPFTSNRVNINNDVNAAAQTGASLISHRPAPSRPVAKNFHQNFFHDYHHPKHQKENIGLRTIPEDVRESPRKRYTNAEKNLMIQLRDAIAHVDFADEQLRRTATKIKDDYVKLTEKLNADYEMKEKALEEEFKRKIEDLEEDQRMEAERMKRERRDIERDRKSLQKETGERDKERNKLIEDQRKRISDLETQMAKFRHEIRSRDEKIRAKDEELEKQAKELERSKKNCLIMEKRIRQMRAEKEKSAREEELFAKAAITNRKCNNYSRAPDIVAIPEMNSRPNRDSRTVSWADSEPKFCEPTVNKDAIMRPAEKGIGEWGPFVIYRDGIGNFSKVTDTIENGRLFEYKNGDKRWINSQKSIIWNFFAIDGAVQLELAHADIMLRFYVNRQMEIWRPNDMISLVSYHRNQIRTEVMQKENGEYFSELYDRNGNVIIRDMIRPDVIRRYEAGRKYTFRDSQTRYVQIQSYDDFEFVEPEFRLRWCRGAMIGCKIFAKNPGNEKTLKLELNIETGEGKLESNAIVFLSFVGIAHLLEHGQQEEEVVMIPQMTDDGRQVFVIDLSDIDHANGAEVPRNLTEEDTKIIPTNIDFAALKEVYAKENKGERFLQSRLFFDDKKRRK